MQYFIHYIPWILHRLICVFNLIKSTNLKAKSRVEYKLPEKFGRQANTLRQKGRSRYRLKSLSKLWITVVCIQWHTASQHQQSYQAPNLVPRYCSFCLLRSSGFQNSVHRLSLQHLGHSVSRDDASSNSEAVHLRHSGPPLFHNWVFTL